MIRKYIIIIFFFISLIYTCIYNKNIKVNKNKSGFTGIVTDYKINGNYMTLILKNQEKIKCSYTIKTEQEKNYLIKNIKYGTSVNVSGEFMIPGKNTIPNTFNYKKYLNSVNINLICKISKYSINNKKIQFIYRIKNWLDNRISKDVNRDYLYMFILGNKTYLDDEIYDTYKSNGIVHLFALSGMHVTFLLSFINLLFKRINDKIYNIFIFIFLLIYLMLVNFCPSFLRAVIFQMLLIIKNKVKMNIDNIWLFLISVSLILFVFPYYILNIGFIYSSVICFGLFYNDKSSNNYIKNALITSIICLLFSLPITVNLNYEINILTILLNVIYIPIVTFIIYPLSVITLFLPIFSSILSILLQGLENMSYLTSMLKINIIIPKISIILIIVYYVVLLLFVKKSLKRCAVYLIIIVIICKIIPYFDSNLYINVLDVNQGDSILIKTNNHKKTILIDSGGVISYKTEKWKNRNKNYSYSNTLISYFKSLGIKIIDYMIITHGDFDHMGETINLVNNFKIEKVIFNCGEFNDLEKELIKVLDKKRIKYYSCIKELNIDNNKLYFLQTKEYDNENDNSNVIYTKLDGYKFMFMGDAGIEKENDILDKYNISDIDVLKIGHHGSKTSSSKEFIDEINPKYSVISVGKNNRYGHPNKEVLNNLEYSKIYRTDQDGSIMFKIKNNRLTIETCSPLK